MSLFYFLAKDGNDFQSLIGRLLTEEYRGTGTSPRFVTVSSQRQGDFGIDGFLPNGSVFQMFFPLQPGLSKLDFPSAVLSKVGNTLKKLEQNKAAIEQAIGNVVLQLVLVIPEDLSPELTGKIREKIQSKGLDFVVFGESKLLNLFSKHFNAVQDCVPQFKGDESADTLNSAAGQLWDKGVNEDARLLYSRAYLVALARKESKAASHALAGLGWCAFITRDLLAALAFAREAGSEASKCEDSHYIASAALIEAKVAFAQRELDEAERLAHSALDHGIKSKSAVRWDAQLTLAEIALLKRDLTEALRRLNLAWRHDMKAGGRRAIFALDLKAQIFERQGKHGLAVRCLDKAALSASELGNFALHAKCLVQALRILTIQNKNRKVLELSKRCEQAAKASGEPRFELEVLMAKAWALLTLGEASRSKVMLNRLVALAESASCLDVGSRACQFLATQLRETGKLDEAAVVANKGSSLARASGDPFLCGLASMEECEQACLRSAFTDASKYLEEAECSFSEIRSSLALTVDLSKLRVRILDGLGHPDRAVVELDALTSAAGEDDELKGAVEWAQRKRDELTGKIQWFATIRSLLREKRPLAWAGTEGATSLQEAHQWVLGILMDWWDGTMGGTPSPCGVYSMWGETNYGRMLLNHRAFSKTSNRPFHLCVEISSVREARLACRMLSPICDCLTLLWKGQLKPGSLIPVFVPFEFEKPIQRWKPRPPKYWKEGTRIYRTVLPPLGRFDLPYPIVKFYMVEARDLVVAGRLVLVPGPMVGCLGSGHDDTEQMFCDVAAADVVIQRAARLSKRHPLEMVVPWFPRIPLRDLAKLCEDHSECLVELRQKCLEWSTGVQNDQELMLAKIRSEIALLSRDVERAFKRVSGTASKGSQLDLHRMKGFGGQAKREEIHSSAVRCESNNRMMAFIEDDLNMHPWFPYWSFEQRGLQLELGAPLHSPGSVGKVPRGAIVNGNVFHWLKAPGKFTFNVLAVRKDIPPGEAKVPGDFKMFEVKDGKMTEVSLSGDSTQAGSGAKGSPAVVANPKTTRADRKTSEGNSQHGHAADGDKRRR